jgi:TonB family protein
MHFDFDGRYEDYEPIGGAVRRWDGVLMSVVVHAAIVLVILFAPALPAFSPAREALVTPPEAEEERPRFVFVQPRLDRAAPKPPPRADASDMDRVAATPEPPRIADNALPFSRGNSAERMESLPEERAAGRGPAPDPALDPPAPNIASRALDPLPDRRPELAVPQPQTRPRPPQGGALGEALRNLQKYVDQEQFNNDRGQVQNLGPLQFDTKGVEFGPWIRRFVAQVRRNWFVPMAAMSLRGRVVLTFNVHRNGTLTDVQVVEPSSIESFNTAAMNALLASDPTEPLPPDYPADKAFFTVTFYYNDSPGQ